MNKTIIAGFLAGALLLTPSCDDFFEPKTSDSLSGDHYMSSLTEMATGYLGVLTRMQAVGDKEIFLTDTRGEMLQPTDQSVNELIDLYNYKPDLTGNSYADPAGYYDLVIACNDYISKMIAFKRDYPELVGETEYFDGLLSSAIRVKVWAYMTIGEIYGQALWFDDPIIKVQDVNDASVFTLMPLPQLVDKCIALLEDGYQGNSAKLDFSWIAWIDSEHISNIAQSSYRYWDQMTPPYMALISKLRIWKAAYLDAGGNGAAARGEYEQVADVILQALGDKFISNVTYWKRGARTSGVYSSMWNYATPNQEESVSAIIYDYTKNQTNRLLHHFSDEYPNRYLLTTSEAGRARFSDKSFAPLGTAAEDARLGRTTKQHNGRWYVAKFRPVGSTVRVNAYQDDVHIYTFRAAELYLWLAEALNHLGRYEALDRILNQGFSSANSDMLIHIEEGADSLVSAENLFQYRGFNSYWVNSKTGGTYNGFRNCMGVGPVAIWDDTDHTAAEAQRHNDELIANEWMLECSCEGKVYPNLIRFAERYNDPGIVVSRVTPKYGNRASEIESRITALHGSLRGYFVPWKL